MDGTWLALGAAAAITLVGRSSKGSKAELPARVETWQAKMASRLSGWHDVPFTGQDFPVWVSFSRQAWGGRGSDRYSVPHPSWTTAQAWMRERESDPDRYGKRLNMSADPPKTATLYEPQWLLPDGGLASDIEIRKTLAGASLYYRTYEWSLKDLPQDDQRRIETIMLARTLGRDDAFDGLTAKLCASQDRYERMRLVGEISWIKDYGGKL